MADLLTADRIVLDFEGAHRAAVLAELGRLLGGNDEALRESVRDELVARERIGTTGVGGGIAFPHARVNDLHAIRLAFVRTFAPIPFDALDDRPVDLFLAVAGPREARRDYLAVLSGLSWMMRSEEVRDRFRHSAAPADLLDLFRERALAAAARP